ncbi:MAG: hypothetical protein A2Y33_13025 [Spirochaetes bacterium GWF1_51_8]|nr:MAG: hypothetical protein A2Y33_13025 [Spirochaetes bacterium GWF1_51_8]
MEFLINSEPADVIMENEKNALEIIQSFQKQLEKNLQISTIEIDGKFYSPESEDLANIETAKIGKINIEVGTQEEIAMSLLHEAKAMLVNVINDIKQNAFSHVPQYNEIIDWIIETLKSINTVTAFHLNEIKILTTTLIQVRAYLNDSAREEDKIPSLCNILENMIQFFDSLQLKISNRFRIDRDDILQGLDSCQRELPEISESLQVGKDREAFGRIHNVINILESCSIYLRQKHKDLDETARDEAEQYYQELNSLLSEIVIAFERGDFVLIADLFEYELPDKLENYKTLISQIDN